MQDADSRRKAILVSLTEAVARSVSDADQRTRQAVHDLRLPLSAIVGYLDLAVNSPTSIKLPDYLDRAQKAAAALAEALDEVSAAARTPRAQPAGFATGTIAEACELARGDLDAEAADLLIIDIAEDLGSTPVIVEHLYPMLVLVAGWVFGRPDANLTIRARRAAAGAIELGVEASGTRLTGTQLELLGALGRRFAIAVDGQGDRIDITVPPTPTAEPDPAS